MSEEYKYKLTYFDWPGLAEISRMIFAVAHVEYEDCRIPIDSYFPGLSPEWKAKLPWGQVPVLEVTGAGLQEPIRIAQSGAINRFLGARFGLAGENEWEAAQCDELVEALKDYFTEYIKYVGESDKAKKSTMMETIVTETTPKYLGKFNARIEGNPAGFFVGNKLSWADIAICEFLTYLEQLFQRQVFDATTYPALCSLRDKLHALPEIKAWLAKRPQMSQEGLKKMHALFQ